MIFFSFFNITLVMRNPKGSDIKWWHVLGTYLNIKEIDARPKPIGTCCNMIFNFSKYYDFFSKKKSDQIISFHIYFSKLLKISNQKKNLWWHVYLHVFNHIVTFWKNYEFLCKIGAITIFGENSFIFSFVGLVTWAWVHIWGGDRENKMSKDECESFYKQIKINHLT
jgi:hypothetical protein